MKISNFKRELHENYQLVSADIDGLEIWFKFPLQFNVNEEDATAFLVAALVPAMLLGEDIEVDQNYFVSESVLSSLQTIQQIYLTWNPIFKPIAVSARRGASTTANEGAACFFSGGVDGSYSLLEHAEELKYAISINGFDFNMDDATWRLFIDRTSVLASELDIELIAVETNFKYFTSAFGIARKCNFGTVLACAGLLLGFEKLYIAAAVTYDMIPPDGSHVLIDEKWSTESTQVIHTGLEANRFKKLQRIAMNDSALENLWVCWKDPRYNCGQCIKCIRTYLALRLAGITEFEFRKPVSIADCKKLPIGNMFEFIIYQAYMEDAENGGLQDKEIKQLVQSAIMNYQFKQFVKSSIRRFFPSLLEWRASKRPQNDTMVDIHLEPRYSDSLVLEDVRRRFKNGKRFKENVNVGTIY